MITKENIQAQVEEWLKQGDYFLVDIQMSGADDRIVIEIDCADGVWIEDCAALSRFLQEHIGDELGDYELEVGSAGLGQPFKVEQQYQNQSGDEVELTPAEDAVVRKMLIGGRIYILMGNELYNLQGQRVK
jgi:ribosome maturation factor RimP